jgi:hypothetical protein
MTITFENDKDVIVYALEKVISYARINQYIFLAQSIWWISSVIGLQEGLIIHIDNLQKREEVLKQAKSSEERREVPKQDQSYRQIHPDRVAQISVDRSVSTVPRDLTEDQRLDRILEAIEELDDSYKTSDGDSVSTTETDIHNEVIDNCEAFLQQSQQERKAVGRFTRQASRVVKRKAEGKANRKKPIKTFGTQTKGIDSSELRRRKAAGECQRCAWPQDRKGSHRTLDCFRWKRLEKGTAPVPKNKRYNKD